MNRQDRSIVRLFHEAVGLPVHLGRRLFRRIPLLLYPLVLPFLLSAVLIKAKASNKCSIEEESWFVCLDEAAAFIHPSRGGLVVLAGTGLIVLLVTRWIAIRSPVGPIEIGDIHTDPMALNGHPGDSRAGELAVAAVLKDRLARSSIQSDQGAIPGYGDLDVGTESTLTSPLAVSGFLARMGLGLLQQSVTRMGWRVHATLRYSVVTGEFGLTYDLEHVATHRSDLVRTVWASSWVEAARSAAYDIAAWQLQKTVATSSRQRPTWRPSGQALRAYEDTRFFGAARRYDDAIHAAATGLRLDPSSLPLRRELGEAHERLGHFMSALHTYAAGLVLVRDRENGWSVSNNNDVEAYWPPGRTRPMISTEAAGILWRYIAVLSFADQWVDRWIGEIERLEAVRHQSRCPHCSNSVERNHAAPFCAHAAKVANGHLPWTGEGGEGHDKAAPEYQRDLADRGEQARQLRGFFARRYADLLANEYPLLKASLFDQDLDRDTPFADPVGSGFDWSGTDDISRRFPIDEWGRPPRPRGSGGGSTIRPGAAAAPSPGNGVKVLHDAINALNRLAEQDPSLDADLRPALDELRLKVTDSPGRRQPEHSQHFICPSRQEIVSLVGHLGALATRQTEVSADDHAALQRSLADLSRFRLSTDLRAFFQRAVLLEVQWLREQREAKISTVVSPRLCRLMWLGGRFRFRQRTAQLRESGTIRPATTGLGPDGRRSERTRSEDWSTTAQEVRRLTSGPASFLESQRARIFGSPGEWNLWYYSACLMALVMEPVPPPHIDQSGRSAEETDAANRRELAEWFRRNDARAEQAVWALDQAVLVRRSGGSSGVDAGVTSWLLFEDPDLEVLRDHPRFYRWASATFGVDVVMPEPQRIAELTTGDDDNKRLGLRGCFGIEGTWARSQKLWRYGNDLALRRLLLASADLVLADLHTLRYQMTTTENPGHLLWELDRRLAAEQDFLLTISIADRFAARPELRLRAQRQLRALAPNAAAQPSPFPTVSEVVAGISGLQSAHLLIRYAEFRCEIDKLRRQAREAQDRYRAIEPLLTLSRSGMPAATILDGTISRWRSLVALATRDFVTSPTPPHGAGNDNGVGPTMPAEAGRATGSH